MSYDASKDKLIKLFELNQNENGKEKSLIISIFSFNNGPKKLQIHRSYMKSDGTTGYGQMGRLTKDEFRFLQNHSEQILEIMESP